MSYFNDATGEYEQPLSRSFYSEETGETYYDPEPEPCVECGDDTDDPDIGRFEEQGYLYCESCWLALPSCAACEGKIVDEAPTVRATQFFHEDCTGNEE